MSQWSDELLFTLKKKCTTPQAEGTSYLFGFLVNYFDPI